MAKNNLKIIFMGTPDFAIPALKALYDNYDVCAVFCQPDKANGRGKKIVFGPVKEFAVNNNIPVYQPETFKNNACFDILKEYNPDLIVVAAYGKILPEYVLNFPRYGCVNIHGSLLPKYRGASPIQSAVLNGDDITGISIMRMDKGLDTGDIIYTENININEYETAGELFERMSLLGANSILNAIELIITDKATYTKQDDSLSSHVSVISKEMGKLDFTLPANRIISTVYGLNPWPSAYVTCSFGNLKIHRVVKGAKCSLDPGSIVSITKKGIEVCCGDMNSIVITELQKPGKKKMDAFSFSLGVKMQIGDLLSDL